MYPSRFGFVKGMVRVEEIAIKIGDNGFGCAPLKSGHLGCPFGLSREIKPQLGGKFLGYSCEFPEVNLKGKSVLKVISLDLSKFN